MKGASGIPSHNMKKIRVPKKDNVVAVLGHKGTFQVLVLIHETGLLTCARWKETFAYRGVGGGSLDITLVSATAQKTFEQVARLPRWGFNRP